MSGANLKWANLSRATWFSPFLRMLPKEVRLLYADLSASCGSDGVMPSDDAGLSVAFGVPPEELGRLLANLLGIGLLGRSEDGRIVVLDTARASSMSKSRVAGGKARQRARKATHAQHHAQHDEQASSSSSSSSSLSDSGSSLSSSGSEPRKRRSGKLSEPKPRADSLLVSDHWCSAFEQTRGAKYVWAGAKDGRHLAELLERTGGDVAEIQRRIDRFLADPFWAPKADWSKFCSQYNAMAGSALRQTDVFAEAERILDGLGRTA